ncbi:macrolide ABC transporter ATP-binding protein [candidate division TA06 bacterium DG_78]|uniref:Macrolide ABC transporter ATP-binding protein n=1 Tax=candidate division TA06 bacterium DG_78 TaxID=1703772 RepID=A0A0S7YDW6_UNCT6|nr:MAG: macrolide ABC transporter ATP-binding protein [candidate division TA06 bacterium DG_78]
MCRAINICKTYWRGKVAVEALRGVNIDIKNNDYTSIMGPSGSGKSTLVHILSCLDTPTSGEYYLEDKLISTYTDLELAKIRNEFFGFVFQSFSLLPRLTALDNVALPLMYSGVNKQARVNRAKDILAKTGLSDRMHHRPNEMSGGECQRVAIARALINNPKVIFADEPTGNLDSRTGTEIMELFDQLVEEGNTVVMVTHDSNVAAHARKIVKLKDGLIEHD